MKDTAFRRRIRVCRRITRGLCALVGCCVAVGVLKETQRGILAFQLTPSSSLLSSRALRYQPRQRQYSSTAGTKDEPTEQEASFVVPLFPLRKSIKLPGESLTLNLYEERYLALAEWLLEYDIDQPSSTNTDPPVALFGALYSVGPQMVTDRGLGPIVPMLRPGDVGVLIVLEEAQEDMIPTAGGVERRRRIRLEGTGVARFVIDEILHNGHGGGVDAAEDPALPFILARVRLYVDDDDGSTPVGAKSPGESLPVGLSPLRWTRLTERATLLGIPSRVLEREIFHFGGTSGLTDGSFTERRAALTSRSTLKWLEQS